MTNPNTNIEKGFIDLCEAIDTLENWVSKGAALSAKEEDTLIVSFKATYDLSLSLMKALLTQAGNTDLDDAPAIFKAAIDAGLIEDEDGWATMLETNHSVSKKLSEEDKEIAVEAILFDYFDLFVDLGIELDARIGTEEE
jgi:hypothetical protein